MDNKEKDTQQNSSFGFVSYREYKETEFYKRYEAARAKFSAEILPAKEDETVRKGKKGTGASVMIVLFGILLIAICVAGYFARKTGNAVLGSILRVFDGKDLITCIMNIVKGDMSDIIEIIGCVAVVLTAVCTLAAVIGSIVNIAGGKGVGKLMKTGCGLIFLFMVVSLIVVLVERLETTIGFSVLFIISGIIAVCALAAPNKEKEKRS